MMRLCTLEGKDRAPESGEGGELGVGIFGVGIAVHGPVGARTSWMDQCLLIVMTALISTVLPNKLHLETYTDEKRQAEI